MRCSRVPRVAAPVTMSARSKTMGLKETTGSTNETSKAYDVFSFAVIDPNYQKSSFLLLNVGGQDSCMLSPDVPRNNN